MERMLEDCKRRKREYALEEDKRVWGKLYYSHAPGLLQKVYLFQGQRNVCKREIQRKSIQGKLRVALLQIPERKGGI